MCKLRLSLGISNTLRREGVKYSCLRILTPLSRDRVDRVPQVYFKDTTCNYIAVIILYVQYLKYKKGQLSFIYLQTFKALSSAN